MRCAHCPLFEYSESEDGSYANCGLFGDGWENPLQYENKDGDTVGCYVEKCYIVKKANEHDKYIAEMAKSYEREYAEKHKEDTQ